MWTLFGSDGSGSAAVETALLAAVVPGWSGTRAHLKQHRPALLTLQPRVESQPDLAPLFARHWPG